MRLLFHVLAVLSLFVTLIFGARAIGASSANIWRSSFPVSDCLPMCWHGIQPGTESINEAKVHLALDPTIAELDQPYSYMISWILPNTPLEVDALHWPGTPGEEVQMIDFNPMRV